MKNFRGEDMPGGKAAPPPKKAEPPKKTVSKGTVPKVDPPAPAPEADETPKDG